MATEEAELHRIIHTAMDPEVNFPMEPLQGQLPCPGTSHEFVIATDVSEVVLLHADSGCPIRLCELLGGGFV